MEAERVGAAAAGTFFGGLDRARRVIIRMPRNGEAQIAKTLGRLLPR